MPVTQASLTEALSKKFSAQNLQVDTTGADFSEPAEAKKDNKAEVETPKLEDKKEVLSNTESAKEEKKTEAVKTEEVKPVDFETLIAERSEGKFKSWEEIKEILDKPQTEFANEQIQKMNEYVKNGGKIDGDWLYYQNTDFDSIEDPFELVSEAMRLKDPNITDKEIEYEIKTKFKTEEWSEDEDDDNEIKEVMSQKLLREAQAARKELNDFKVKTSFSTPQKSEGELRAEASKSKEVQENWEKTVDDNIKGFDKIPVKIDDKETFEVIVSDDEKKSLGKLSKSMGTSLMPLLSKFMDKKGNIDVRMLQEGLYKMQNFDNAVKAAYNQAIAKGQQMVVKDVKNTNFNPDSKTDLPKQKTLSEQIKEHFVNNQH